MIYHLIAAHCLVFFSPTYLMSLVNETKSTFWSGFIFAVGANALWGLAFLIPKILFSFTSIEITLGRYLFYANSIFLKNNPHILSSTWSTLIGVNT